MHFIFSYRVAAAISIFQEYQPELADYQPTIKFIRRINRLIEVMMSRTPIKALRLGSNEKAVRIFILFYTFIFFYFLIFIKLVY